MGKFHFAIFLFILLVSCSDTKSSSGASGTENDGIQVRVTRQMGQLPADTIRYLPLLGSLAESKMDGNTSTYLILGKNIENGDNLYIKELSTLVYSHGEKIHKVIVSVPLDERFKSLNVNSFEELATSFGSVKWALESWYNHFGGLGNSRFIEWENVSRH